MQTAAVVVTVASNASDRKYEIVRYTGEKSRKEQKANGTRKIVFRTRDRFL